MFCDVREKKHDFEFFLFPLIRSYFPPLLLDQFYSSIGDVWCSGGYNPWHLFRFLARYRFIARFVVYGVVGVTTHGISFYCSIQFYSSISGVWCSWLQHLAFSFLSISVVYGLVVEPTYAILLYCSIPL